MTNPTTYDRRAVFSWCLYDFANSPFTTLVVTFIYGTFFTKSIAENEIIGTALWSRGITITALIVALLSPLLGAMADRLGRRKRFLAVATIVTILFTTLLYFPRQGQVMLALTLFVIANIAYELGCVFYNAFLPEIAPPAVIGRVSGYGWSLGYAGGLLAMVLALVGFINPEVPWFGLSKDADQNIRATCLLVSAWFILFSIPTFLWVRECPGRSDTSGPPASFGAILKSTLAELKSTFHEIRQYRQIVRLLLARLFYNDGIITVFAFAGIYAQGTFQFSFPEVVMLGIIVNVAAGLGAFLMGFMDDRLGGKKTIQVSLVGLSLAVILAISAVNKPMFWIAGILAGIFSGPNQASSRSLMGRFVPPAKENEFYGFFAFSGKATSFLGPLLFGVMSEMFNSQRPGVACVLIFFILGGILLHWVDEMEGIRVSGRQQV